MEIKVGSFVKVTVNDKYYKGIVLNMTKEDSLCTIAYSIGNGWRVRDYPTYELRLTNSLEPELPIGTIVKAWDGADRYKTLGVVIGYKNGWPLVEPGNISGQLCCAFIYDHVEPIRKNGGLINWDVEDNENG